MLSHKSNILQCRWRNTWVSSYDRLLYERLGTQSLNEDALHPWLCVHDGDRGLVPQLEILSSSDIFLGIVISHLIVALSSNFSLNWILDFQILMRLQSEMHTVFSQDRPSLKLTSHVEPLLRESVHLLIYFSIL
jgi:hypothetical protein